MNPPETTVSLSDDRSGSSSSEVPAVDEFTLETRERMRWIAYVACFAWLAGTLVYGISPLLWRGVLIQCGASALTLFMFHWGLRNPSRFRIYWGAEVAIAINFLGLVALSSLTGQGSSPVVWVLVTVPASAAYLIGTRSGFVWLGLCLLGIIGLHVVTRLAPVVPERIFNSVEVDLLRVLALVEIVIFALASRRANDKYTDELLVKQRVIDDQAQKLKQSLDAAEAANRVKGEFLATMSHEMRTPLNGVIGLNGLLLDSQLNEEQRKFVSLSRLSGEVLLHLINDILDYSKIEAGRLELEPVDFDLRQVCREGMDLLLDRISQKGLEATVDVGADVPEALHGDSSRLRQILVNLLSNAVKFTERGSVTLSCRQIRGKPESALHSATWFRFEVVDSGIGMDEATVAKLFRPFVQAHASITRHYGGTGLGLAISRQLAELMNGRIGVTSQLGVGSCFWLELPFSPANAEPSQVISDQNGEDIPQLVHGRVLVAEDNPINQLVAVGMLKRLGCLADVVGNGKEAVEAIRRLPYDLVFMDCHMPEMDGFEASRKIRDEEAGKRHVPIIAMTASALSGDRERCLDAGMDDYVPKPIRASDLAQVVNRWVRKPIA